MPDEVLLNQSAASRIIDEVVDWFRHRVREQELLKYLRDSKNGYTAKEIAAHFFPSEMSSPDAIRASIDSARQLIKRTRAALDQHYEDKGHSSPARVIILERPYRLDVVPRNPTPPQRPTSLVWAPYIEDKWAIRIGYTIPVFARDSETTTFYRDVRINSEDDFERNRLSGDAALDGRTACYAYVPLGEVGCTLRLLQWFHEAHRDLKVGYFSCFNSSTKANAIEPHAHTHFIIAGASRTNGLIASLQKSHVQDLSVELETIANRKVIPDTRGEQPTYRERKLENGRIIAPCLVTRLRLATNQVVTVFSGNHGRAIQRLAELLSDDTQLRIFLTQQFADSLRGPFPEEWQLLFDVEISELESSADKCTLVTYRPRPWMK
jgi:hypothetical protein